MTRLIATRLALSVVLVVIASFVIFLLMSFVPGDPARTILGANATPDLVARLRDQLGLDRPLPVQYGTWLAGVLHGDLGRSVLSGDEVSALIVARVPVTASLLVLSTLVIGVLGTLVGLVSAVRGGVLGKVLDTVSLFGLALPSYWIAIVLVAAFAVAVRVFPATGYRPFADGPLQWLLSLVLPVAALSLGGITIVAKQMRDSALDVLARDYVRVLRASGIRERSIVFRHVLRNAALPSLTVLGITVVASLTGAVFVENVFVLPGLGSLVTQATTSHDLPVVLGVGVVFTLFVIVVNVVVDVLYGVLNPKVRVR
ncbi:ABC transporter permease [Kineococcus rhizosphaerae]|uniref:Peptide/nickel transport system permease protein n=1 Tax=Kineococcus rhizosphaerae TaxID=559628 RepID=A0A2T0R148_9ACTN|nr:ABC transporter permease [Kineococcus rhizosphaerae]PRY13052.1 peptide/nickel transport system permease protein [Kineococcus rhizosphaerae]